MWLALGRSQRMLALGAALVLVAAAAIFVLPWLKVQRVEVEGSPAVPRPELLQQAGVRIGQSSLLVDTAAMTRDLLAQPWVGSAQVRVSWPSTLVLVVEPLPPALEYQRDGVRLPLAGNGALLGSAASGVIGGLPLLVDQRPGAGGRAGEVVVPPRLARALAALATVFPKTYGVSVERFVLDRVGALEIQSGAGWTADLGLALTQGQIAGLGPKLEALRALAARVDLKAPGIREIYLEDPAQVTVSP